MKEFMPLYRLNYTSIPQNVANQIRNTNEMISRIEPLLNRAFCDLDVLEIGPGQRGVQRYVLGGENRYTGIDIEVNELSNALLRFARTLRQSGITRAIKSGVRDILGVERKFRYEIMAQLDLDNAPGEILEMDAASMTFPDASFDVVYSQSVFEHLSDVEGAISSIARVLKPGGVAAILTHIYTSDTGIHDPRLFGNRAELPYWSHLRPETHHLVSPNCYINKFRLDDYRESFSSGWPGAIFELFSAGQKERDALAALRAKGALREYSDEELLTDVLCTLWKKPRIFPEIC